jgi:hypothetical protein
MDFHGVIWIALPFYLYLKFIIDIGYASRVTTLHPNKFHDFKVIVLYFEKRNIGDCDKTPYKVARRTVAGDGDINVDENEMHVCSYY